MFFNEGIYMYIRFTCKVCGKESNVRSVMIKEMLNGTNDEFEYYECEHCKSLQIKNIPDNLYQYYQQEYYSFKTMNKLIKTVKSHLYKNYLYGNFIGGLLSRFIEDNKELFIILSELLNYGIIDENSRILDIGCGNGDFLDDLANVGFKNLNGLEPYIEQDLQTENFTIYKNVLREFNLKKEYDLIFLKDSLEHMDNPYEDLLKVKSLLSDDGAILISIPVKTEYFWDLYGVNWFQLDAPRHLVIPTLEGMKTLMENLDLRIERTIFNSTPYSVIISEDYSNGESMYSEGSFSSRNSFKNEFNKHFKKLDLKFMDGKVTFKQLNKYVDELNEKQKSEHAVFLIRKND